jgi:uncharacterized repeat protein (TIGR01451 family)
MAFTPHKRQDQKGGKQWLARLLTTATLLWGASQPASAEIINSVVASGTAGANTVSVSAIETVDVADQIATITLDKAGVYNDVNGNGIADAADTISYNFTVTNTGNVTLTNVVLTDNKATPAAFTLSTGDVAPLGDSTDTPAAGWATLAPGDTLTTSATYALLQADLDAGQAINVANVTSSTIPGLVVAANDSVTTPLTTAASIALEKSGVLTLGNGVADVGDIVSYQFKVTNTGPTTLTNVTIADALLLASALPNANSVQDLIQVAAIASDPITTASIAPPTSLGAGPREPAVWHAPLPEVATALHASRKLVRLTQDAEALKAGDRIGVYFTLTNAGAGPLTDIIALQPGSDSYGSALDLLAPNTTNSASIIFTHLLTAEDIATGQVDLVSGLTAKSRDRTVVTTLRGPMSLLDVEDSAEIATASITPVNVPTLAPGANTVFTATYAITQADIDAGQVLNTATASATTVTNALVAVDDSATVAVPKAPAITVEKIGALALGPDNEASVGDLITYTLTLTNTGNTTLNDVTLTDPLPGINITFTPFDNFAPGADQTFTGTYAITQVDIDAGKVENQASVSGLPANAPTPVTDLSDDPSTTPPNDKTVVEIPAAPGIALIKNAPTLNDTNSNGVADLGESLTWTFAVHNTGNVRLQNVSVTDQNSNVTVSPAAPTTVSLDAGDIDTTTFTATYVLTQIDLDAGQVENNADVIADAPDGTTTGDASHPSSTTENGPTLYTIPPNPGLAVLKPQPVVVDTNNNGQNDTGDVLNYVIRVINTGNVTLTNVTVTDPAANNFTTVIPSIAPGNANSVSVAVAYAITPADMTAGQVENIAFAEAVYGGTPVGDQSDTDNIAQDDPTITPIIPNAAIALVKPQPDIIDVDANGVTNEGDQLVYTFAVTNRGNVSLNNFSFTDPLGTVVSTRTTPLIAGDTDNTSFKLTYTLTLADITLGTVTNTADVVALSPTNLVARDTSDNDSILQNDPTVTTLSNLIAPSIALLKQFTTTDVNGNNIIDAGDVINYTFSVTNNGNVNLNNVRVTDAKLALEGITLNPGNGVIGSLARGATSAVLSASRVITQADVDIGFYENQASVSGDFGSRTVTDLSDNDQLNQNDLTVVNIARNPAIAVVKAAPTNDDRNGNGFVDAGDILHYTFVIHNIGNITLFNVALADNNADTVLGGPIASMLPGAIDNTTYTATRLVTDVDALAGEIVNSATVRAAESNGGILSITDVSDVASLNGREPTVTPVVILNPSLSKTASRSTVRRGERVEYTIAATLLGTGPYDIADIMPAGFDFVPGSATVNGVAAVPAVSGKTLSFANITPTPARRIVVKLSLRAATSTSMATGEFVNHAKLYLNANGQLLDEATARVTIKEEHIFDCGEIIGRVFDDLNSNGYMDDGEPGLPGVRVVTVKGLLVTTDAHGRFHVTCADVPNAQIGSNFLMKLDPRTLPAGYALTSENPRDVRLTRGKITKLNFGASKRREVALDLTRDAFGAGTELKPKFATGIGRLVGLLKQGRGQLTITYRCGVYAPVADERLSAVEELVQATWKQEGGNKPLKITTRVECGK